VHPAPPPPEAWHIAGSERWTAADQKKTGFDSPPPAGPWEIVFDGVGIWELDPLGGDS